ncbi:hypothetical protein [Nocardioides bizhenqiangii]|uniref:ESX secretion-associated protein EspG n=1 Tax=Nocardioides bizhenqiangii TaxID=3095076 RepID=A0ABZ0ZMN9_9ACTN|nr:hypothetical protein [Nocardioides sp. HM61]WQQ25616.1 hypothetical protein SHK19_16815 [Nocardioides sp. HM61]
MIRVGERTLLARPRRIALGVDKWVALQRSAESVGLRLPQDVRLQIEPVDVALAGADLARASTLLRDHGVIDDDGPVPAVAANLAALGAADHRIRVSLAGPDVSRLGYHWVDAHLGGSLVRDGLTHTLSLFDARAIGTELLALVPEPDRHGEGREPFSVPLAAVGPVAAIDDDVPGDLLAATGELVGLHPRDVTRLHEWSRRTRAVLHVTAVGRDRAPHALVWFLDRDGWWSGRTSNRASRTLTLEPRRRADLPGELGNLVAGAWL